MFISNKRHEREKQALVATNKVLTEAILGNISQGLLFLDSKGKIMPQVSQSLAALFRRRDFNNLSFEKLLMPHVTAKVMSRVRNHLAGLRESASRESDAAAALTDVEVRLKNDDGSFDRAHFAFEFTSLEAAEAGMWMVRVTDITGRVQQEHELAELRAQLQTHAEMLRSILRLGRARFATALQKIAGAMKSINEILKKPAREEGAFRHKLEETLDEVDRIRRAGKAVKLTAMENAARDFEDALHELGSRPTLSGSDFLPLAVKLDALFGQFAMVRALMTTPRPAHRAVEREPGVERRRSRAAGALAGALKIDAMIGEPAGAHSDTRNTQAGGLESALVALAEHIALEQGKHAALECAGLELVPQQYQTPLKNIAVQLIRNAVIHGIETAEERARSGKPDQGTMRMEFTALEDGGYELLFQDDGRGLDPDHVRRTAVEKGLISTEAADKLRDRQAIKLIFKAGFTTATESAAAAAQGTGLAFVRRYVHQAGGKIALASLQGHEVRFKVCLPPIEATGHSGVAGSDAELDAEDPDAARVA